MLERNSSESKVKLFGISDIVFFRILPRSISENHPQFFRIGFHKCPFFKGFSHFYYEKTLILTLKNLSQHAAEKETGKDRHIDTVSGVVHSACTTELRLEFVLNQFEKTAKHGS